MPNRNVFFDVTSFKPYLSDTATDGLKDICIGEFMITGSSDVFGTVLVGSKEEMLEWADRFKTFVMNNYVEADIDNG